MADLIDEVGRRTEEILGRRTRAEVIAWLRRLNKSAEEWIAMDDAARIETAAFELEEPPAIPENAPEWYKHKWGAPDDAPPPGPEAEAPAGAPTPEELARIRTSRGKRRS